MEKRKEGTNRSGAFILATKKQSPLYCLVCMDGWDSDGATRSDGASLLSGKLRRNEGAGESQGAREATKRSKITWADDR